MDDDSLASRIIDNINSLHKNDAYILRFRSGSCAQSKNDRKIQLYRPFIVSNDIFFWLRSQGVPILTAFFLSESGNMCRLHRQLQEKHYSEREDALSILNNNY